MDKNVKKMCLSKYLFQLVLKVIEIVIERVMKKIDNVDENNFSMSSEKHLKLVFDSFKNVFKKSNMSVAMQFHGI